VNPLVSIIIPVYNGSNYLGAAIDSALAQTYKNCEILVINDGSTDNGLTESVALKYGSKIRYFVKKNGGCGSALNYGLDQMRGEYFSWLSHDDLYLPNKIQHQIKLLECTQEEIPPIVYGGYEIIDADSSSVATVYFHKNHSIECLNLSLYPVVKNLIHGCSLLIHRSWIDRVGKFDESLLHTQDYDYWLRLMRLAPIIFDSEILIKSRVHPGQTTYSEGRNEECNRFWSNLLKSISPKEMASMNQSEFVFYSSMKSQLSKTPFKEAALLASEFSINAFSKNKSKSFFEWMRLAFLDISINSTFHAVITGDISVRWIVMKLREDGLWRTAKRILKF
jgi:glycosyltransferase involved in cell wall biosynthesis